MSTANFPVVSSSQLCRACLVKNNITCLVCFRYYTEPIELPCQHLVCKEPCLSSLLADLKPGDRVQCPICNREFTVPSLGLNGLKECPMINKLAAMPDEKLEQFAQHLNRAQTTQTGQGSETKMTDLKRKQATRKTLQEFELYTGGTDNVDLDKCVACHSSLDNTKLTTSADPRPKRSATSDAHEPCCELYRAPSEGDNNSTRSNSAEKNKQRNGKKKHTQPMAEVDVIGGTDVACESRDVGTKDKPRRRFCPVCRKKLASKHCLHCKRDVCDACHNAHMQPMINSAIEIIEDYNSTKPSKPIHGFAMDNPRVTVLLTDGTKKQKDGLMVDPCTYFQAVQKLLGHGEMAVYSDVTNYIEDKLAPQEAHERCIDGLIDRKRICDREIKACMLKGDGQDVSHIQQYLLTCSSILQKMQSIPLDQPVNIVSLTDLESHVIEAQTRDSAKGKSSKLVAKMVMEIAKIVDGGWMTQHNSVTERVDVTEPSESNASGENVMSKRKRKRNRRRAKAAADQAAKGPSVEEKKCTCHVMKAQGQGLRTHRVTSADGTERLNWGDRDDQTGIQLYLKGALLGCPDGTGNKLTPVPLTDQLSADIFETRKQKQEVERPGNPISDDFPYSMERIHEECKILAVQYKKNRGHVITRKLTEEVSLRAEPGGDNGTPNIIIEVNPRPQEEFLIPADHPAAAAIAAAGGEENFRVDYAVGKDGKVRPYLRSRNRKLYKNFDEFEFDNWKVPGVGSGITADGCVVYGVGRGGHIEVKGDEEQEEQFNTMVMDTLDDID